MLNLYFIMFLFWTIIDNVLAFYKEMKDLRELPLVFCFLFSYGTSNANVLNNFDHIVCVGSKWQNLAYSFFF